MIKSKKDLDLNNDLSNFLDVFKDNLFLTKIQRGEKNKWEEFLIGLQQYSDRYVAQ